MCLRFWFHLQRLHLVVLNDWLLLDPEERQVRATVIAAGGCAEQLILGARFNMRQSRLLVASLSDRSQLHCGGRLRFVSH